MAKQSFGTPECSWSRPAVGTRDAGVAGGSVAKPVATRRVAIGLCLIKIAAVDTKAAAAAWSTVGSELLDAGQKVVHGDGSRRSEAGDVTGWSSGSIADLSEGGDDLEDIVHVDDAISASSGPLTSALHSG